MAKKKFVTKKRTSRVRSKVTETETSPVEQSTGTSNDNKRNKLVAAIVLITALLALAAYTLYKQNLVAAYVNGESISRLQVIRQLEKQNGKNILDQIITEKIILQEAKKRNITVTKQDTDREMKTIEDNLKQQGMTLDQALQTQGMTKDQLNDQMRIQVLIQKMVKPPTVTDDEVTKYIAANSEQLTEEQLAQPNFKTQIKEQLQQQKLQAAIQKFVEDLKAKSKITTVSKY